MTSVQNLRSFLISFFEIVPNLFSNNSAAISITLFKGIEGNKFSISKLTNLNLDDVSTVRYSCVFKHTVYSFN